MTEILSLTPPDRPRLLDPGRPGREDLASYLATGGYPAAPAPERLVESVAAAGLRGRGGAGFPTAVKLRTLRDAPGDTVVVANGEEGEPGSVKDRWLLRHRPHTVLDGVRLAARTTGAVRGYVYLSDPQAADAVRRALLERPPTVPVDIVLTEHTYVAGEESAVVRRIDGGPALPTTKPPRPFERGVGGAPTLIANVETLARLALLTAHPDAAVAVASSHLLTLSGGPAPSVLAEAPAGTHLGTLAGHAGRGGSAAVLLGGLFGGLYGDGWAGLRLDHDELVAAGGALGCGAIHFLPPGGCPVGAAADAAGYLAAQSARQCGVCVSGTQALAGTLAALARGEGRHEDTGKLHRWSQGLTGRGACGLLDASAHIAATLLRHFPDRVRAHEDGPCPSCADAPPPDGSRLGVTVP
ncbi:NADH-ubiquinone oxidoreductase-F iron-sulfur binding region domain-containing protein [Streptomyces cellostaticus]|uniref:NADH-ubiquinone oxidoreductase-F iron-sulfur binding region domain-containing protein n=1 Tax=Streptomyces cellostaticus TaxID=67285 RepID=UPI002027490A|nr:NADH-ubiquinone oxidoreductase-F iron-sulfur binding region domain-containing protein [Streptomyces cellostaticus]